MRATPNGGTFDISSVKKMETTIQGLGRFGDVDLGLLPHTVTTAQGVIALQISSYESLLRASHCDREWPNLDPRPLVVS